MAGSSAAVPHEIRIEPPGLFGLMSIPQNAKGLVLFAHGSGSGRHSPRNNYVAAGLREAGIGTLLLDLLKPAEERDRRNVFDIELLASRLLTATDWAADQSATRGLPVGYFGASTGAGAALLAAAERGRDIAAVVSRGGRPDLAMEALPEVTAPTLLLVGELDGPVIDLNAKARQALRAPSELIIIPGAGHLFEEPGTLDQVIVQARVWFLRCFADVGIEEARSEQPGFR